jgi:hypothetical protein
MMFSRKDVAAAAKDLAAHLALFDDVANLQKMQKEIADAIAKLNDRLIEIIGVPLGFQPVDVSLKLG